MPRLTRTVVSLAAVIVTVIVLIGAMMTTRGTPVRAAETEATEAAKEPAPPAGQSYTGVKRCASCHFKQYLAWKKTKHSKTFSLLTAKYENDPTCLKCHTTGYGKPTGYKSASDTSLQGTTCEACHGPGSAHEEVCEAFKNKKLSEQEEKTARDSIWLVLPGNVCITCHVVQAHEENPTPPDMRSKD